MSEHKCRRWTEALETEGKLMTEDGRAGVRTYLVGRRKARTLNIGGEMSFRQTVLQKEKKRRFRAKRIIAFTRI